MAALRTIKAVALNVTTEPPHSPTRYEELFDFIRNLESPPSGQIGGSDRIMLNYYAKNEDAIIGTFARYTHIDPNSPWWDTENRKAILDAEGNPIPQTKEGIGPNLKEIFFIFYIKHHMYVVDCRNISPGQFAKGLNIIFSYEKIISTFGPITVTVIPTSDVIDKLISLPNKRRIEVVFTLPNGDVPDMSEEEILERYKGMNAGKIEEKVTSQDRETLEPDTELITKMRISQMNGYATVDHILPNGRLEKRSTKDFPRYEKERYAHGAQWNALRTLGKRFVESIKRT